MPDIEESLGASDKPSEAPATGLDRIDRLAKNADIVINALPWLDRVGEKVLKITDMLEAAVISDPDAAIAFVHLPNTHRYSTSHAVQMAILCHVTCDRLAMEGQRRQSVVAAALSSNASIQRLQDQLHSQYRAPSAEQLREMRAHPDRSTDHLRRTGVEDELWLEIVAQHHERPDGCGYPLGLKSEQITEEALMVGLADRYAACIGPNAADHAASSAKNGLREVFKDPSYADFETMVAAFIKELTLFPPGSLVRLDDDSEALVVRRTDDSMCPIVAVIDEAPDATPPQTIETMSGQIVDSIPVRPLPTRYREVWGS